MLAAFWSISWPAWILSVVIVILSTSGYSVDVLQYNLSLLAIGGNLVFFAVQALLTRRLVRKNYRSFRLYVVRDHGSTSRDLSMREAFAVWRWILWPQLALLLLTSVVVWLWGANLPPDSSHSLSSLSQWLRFGVVGPYGLGLALRRQYPDFRLRAHGFRYV
jgi:hypothetical protein